MVPTPIVNFRTRLAFLLTDPRGGGAGTKALAVLLVVAGLTATFVAMEAQVSTLLFGTPHLCSEYGDYPPAGVFSCLAPVPSYGRNTIFGGFCPNMLGSDPDQPRWRSTDNWVGDRPICVRP